MKNYLPHDAQHLIAGAVILLVTLGVASLLRWAINREIQRDTARDNRDPTTLLFSKRAILALVYLAGIGLALAQVPQLKDIGHSLLAGAGVLTLVTGLASQQVLGNIMSGILIVVFKPFRLDDKITVANMTGTVEDINLRQIVLRDAGNNRIVIPNLVVNANALVNFNQTDSRCCEEIVIRVAYATDLDQALSIMVDEVSRHALHIDGRSPGDIARQVPEVVARVIELAESSVNLKVWAWARDSTDGFVMRCDLLKSIKQRFDREGIEIPVPQRAVSITREGADQIPRGGGPEAGA